MDERKRMSEDFDKLSNEAKEFMRKWGNPYMTIIIESGRIRMCQEEMANAIEIQD